MFSNSPFLTEIDPQVRVRGSRDPLGFQTIWTAFGRRVVKNLTTVTTSLRGFTTYILGIYFAEKLVDSQQLPEDEISNIFLKFEQLAAYSRIAISSASSVIDDDEIRGILRVKRNLSEGNVNISAKQQSQILSNQKTYGLWGLYSVASRNSGLLEENASRLTPLVREFVESEYIPKLDSKGQNILNFLKQEKTFDPKKKDSILSKQLSDIHKNHLNKTEKNFYYNYLLSCNVEQNIQILLWELIKRVNKKGNISSKEPFSMIELREIIKNYDLKTESTLVHYLDDIRLIEQVIGPLDLLFSYLLTKDRQTIEIVHKDIASIWNQGLEYIEFDAFKNSLIYVKEQHADEFERLINIAFLIKSGQFKKVIELLLEQNEYIMRKRGLNPWVILKKGRLDVRFSEQPTILPEYNSLDNLWRNNYFINSLKKIGFEIEKDSGNGS